MNHARRIRAALLATTVALTFGTGVVRAETTGDLYVASAAGILEVVTASASVLDTVPVSPSPGSIAIRPDGRELFALSGDRQIVGIDLESMTVTSHIALPAPGAAIAYPRGEELVAAMPSLRRLAIRDAGTDSVRRSEPLPGAVDLLAADRRDGRVVVAASGGHWVAVFDSAGDSMRSVTVRGSVTAVALDATAGIAVVAMTKPNRVVGLDLHDFATTWSMSLSAAPTAVAVVGTTTLLATGRLVWAIDHAAPGAAAVGISTAELHGRRWASLAKPATALTVSDDGSLVYALEADRVEGFTVNRSAADQSTAATAARSIKLAGSQAPKAIVTVPGAEPLLGGPGNASSPGTRDPGDAVPAPVQAADVPPPTDTVLDEPARWLDANRVLPQAILIGTVILILGLLAIRQYERGYGEPSKVPATSRSSSRK